ncbi:MAG TPA: LLM class F420-dependent oxidoreductase [Rhodospirillaceae bacterium]|nr:LLM class F420-dependent oxidoreductase [Rhodospirillaceae bacterium]HAA93070.1 LLM class F420-dependent oxidoreductase [Rhodospirillaceae bacterium]HAT35531.1 LLM class F420-dependent oxidoreductase [Rhodospirillaceae bacterium]
MGLKIGYLLPTRENIMEGRPAATPLLTLAEKAEGLGYDSLWIGDSILARPRHDPITLMSAVAARTKTAEIGTAVLLPALRNPVVLAHQIATLDQISEGRIILGMGIAADVPNIHAEFEACGVPWEKRVGRFLEGIRLCQALWTGEPVDWDGRWKVEQGIVGPMPHRKGGPPIWGGGAVPGALKRVARNFDGWFPTGPDAAGYGERLKEVRRLTEGEGRKADDVTAAIYLTIAIDDDPDKANERIDEYLYSYYHARPDILKKRQACFGGTAEGAVEWLQGYVDQGARHIVLRFAGDHDNNLDRLAGVGEKLKI